jgi:hypothetical protein
VLHNRFVGDHLLYGAGNGWWETGSDTGSVFVLPWRAATLPGSVSPPGGPDQVMGRDAVVVGASGGDLHFSGVRLGERPVVAQRFVVDSASQGETRSHGFFYRADDERSGVLGLPVRAAERPGWEHLVHGSASCSCGTGTASSAGSACSSRARRAEEDDCGASCVDWYGNAAPLFLRGRILALLGYELVEGTLADGGLREAGRSSFAPRAATTTLRIRPSDGLAAAGGVHSLEVGRFGCPPQPAPRIRRFAATNAKDLPPEYPTPGEKIPRPAG